ncbi:MAG: SAM-dependent methyltransferase, partial [Pseudonocardia sp.]
YDLVSACYFHTPVELPREEVLQRAARAVAPGGLLVIVEHASVAPWSWNRDDDVHFPSPAETLAALALDDRWRPERVDAPGRVAEGPEGQTATVTDNVIAVRLDG